MATIILKVTEKCNSNCYYCDVMYKAGEKKSMSFEVLENVFVRIKEYLCENYRESVEIIWHGGEPLLVGANYFLTANELQKLHCSQVLSRIKHSIQTNLTCFDQTFVPPLKELKINCLGTSFDPEPNMRGAGLDIDSTSYNKRFFQGLIEAERNGFSWGLIYVVTKKSLIKPLEVFHFLTNLELSGGVSFNPVLIYDNQRKDISITAEEYKQFLGNIFPVWWKYRRRYPNVNPFNYLVMSIIEGHLSLGCNDSGSCSYNQVNIAPDGETSQCGRSADWGILPYGNIKERPLKEILRDPQRDELDFRIKQLEDTECQDCRFWNLCHGGCPLDAYSKHGSFQHKSGWCEAKRGFLSEYFEPVTGVRYEPKK